MNVPAARARSVTTVVTNQPGPVTLRAMGQTANAAADTWTLRHWAGVLASRAGPKDYRGQLRQLYNGIVERWRYVMEPGEWIHGTPRSLLGVVLGLDYNGVKDSTRADVARTPSTAKGWGDCDDVSTLAAAGVLALGMRPMWRVSRAPTGEAHVSVAAITPRGEVVQIDPVGHPDHGFGWAQSGPGVEVQYHALDGLPVDAPNLGSLPTMNTAFRPASPASPAPQFYPRTMLQPPAAQWYAVPFGFGSTVDSQGTYLGVLARAPRAGLMPYQGKVRRHLVAVAPNDTRGPRVLACPGMHARAMMRGVVMDGTPAVDQYGDDYTYNHSADLWVPRASMAGRVSAYGFGATRAARRAKRKARRRRTAKKVGRFFKKVGQGIRKVASKIMGSKLVQTIVAGALQIFGVPMRLTRKLLAVASKFVGGGGLFKLLRGLRKNPKKVLSTIAKTVSAAGRSDLLKGIKGLSGFGSTGYAEPVIYELEQGGRPYYAAPVEGIVGVDGAFGDAGEGSAIAAEPTPGYFYRVKKGDNPSDIAEAAYGKALPGGKWISQSQANAYATRPTKTDFEKKYYGDRIISLLTKYNGAIPGAVGGDEFPVLWIPPAAGVEPSVSPNIPDALPDVEPDEDLDDDEDLTPTPAPMPIPVPPAPPIPPTPDEFDDEPTPSPQPPPPIPVIPVKPDPTPLPVEPDTPPPVNPLKPIPWDDATPTPDPYGPGPTPTPVGPITPSGPPRPSPVPTPPPGPAGGKDSFMPLLALASILLA